MDDFPSTWTLCGGWAVDAWLERQTRDHGDVDIAIFRSDERAFFEHLADWHLAAHDTADAAHDDRWDGHALAFPAHIHATFDDGLGWEAQINERSGRQWILSRRPRVAIPLSRFARPSSWGLPTMAPEALLWYKSQEMRPHDEQDFMALLPRLTADERTWLERALSDVDRAHPWLAQLAARSLHQT
jgi:hypothetical protein